MGNKVKVLLFKENFVNTESLLRNTSKLTKISQYEQNDSRYKETIPISNLRYPNLH